LANRDDETGRAVWLARAVVGAVFAVNVACALSFLARPEAYAPGFELSGVPGRALVRGLGILFLMWNATYPPVILQPARHRLLFAVVLAQQAIGLAGEAWLWLALPEGHDALRATGLRFIVFDGAGLLALIAGYALSAARKPPAAE
jgi:hypothetical protein